MCIVKARANVNNSQAKNGPSIIFFSFLICLLIIGLYILAQTWQFVNNLDLKLRVRHLIFILTSTLIYARLVIILKKYF